MHCAAAPIRDIHGSLAGVLDISSESIEFGFDAASVVGHLACTIENRLLIAQSMEHLIVRVQVASPLLDSSAVGMVGVRQDGRVAWVNGVASRLLGVEDLNRTHELPLVESVLGANFGRLASMPHDEAAVLSLPNGLSLWVRTELRGKDGSQVTFHAPLRAPQTPVTYLSLPRMTLAPMPVENSTHRASQPDGPVDTATTVGPVPALVHEPIDTVMATNVESGLGGAPTVQTTHQELLQRTLQENGGNLSKAARCLGVSRGWIYRRVRSLQRGQHNEPESARE